MIIGLAGTHASGKDTLAHHLASNHGFLHVSTGDILRDKKKELFGDAVANRGDDYANQLRAEEGPGVLVKLAYERYLRSKDKYPGGLVASGIRSIGEAELIQELGGKVVFVDADIKVRYKRVISRARDRNDEISLEDFAAHEKIEKPTDVSDKTIQNLTAMKSMADIRLDNSGVLDNFLAQAKAALELTT